MIVLDSHAVVWANTGDRKLGRKVRALIDRMWPLGQVAGTVAVRALDLAGLHDDPADRFIVATALIHAAALVTADDRLLDWCGGLERYDARE